MLLENLILRPTHAQFARKDLICSVFENSLGSYPASSSEAVIAAAEKKKVAIMISVVGKKTCSVLRDLCSPVNPKDKTFKQLCELLQHVNYA